MSTELLHHTAFREVPLAPLTDQIIAVTEAFRRDSRNEKINLSIGVYRDEQGRLPLFESIRRAETVIAEQEARSGGGKPYAPIEGLPEYREATCRLIFGDEIDTARVVTVQTVGGSGALTLAAIFIREFLKPSTIYLASPCWANHPGIFQLQKLSTTGIPYYDRTKCRVDIDGLKSALDTIPEQSVVLLQAACHNPSGVDLKREDWKQLAHIFQRRGLVAFIDFAYQGLAETPDQDAFAVRHFANEDIPTFVAHSFSKSMSLYGERVGSLSVVTENRQQAQAVMSQLKNIVRPLYSNSPIHGAKTATVVLNTPDLNTLWEIELGQLRTRITSLRHDLCAALTKHGVRENLEHIANGHGMFALLNLTPQQVAKLAEQHAIYLVPDGRICIPALSGESVERVAAAIASNKN